MRGGVIGPTTISYEIIEEIQPIAALEACHYGWYAYKTAQERHMSILLSLLLAFTEPIFPTIPVECQIVCECQATGKGVECVVYLVCD